MFKRLAQNWRSQNYGSSIDQRNPSRSRSGGWYRSKWCGMMSWLQHPSNDDPNLPPYARNTTPSCPQNILFKPTLFSSKQMIRVFVYLLVRWLTPWQLVLGSPSLWPQSPKFREIQWDYSRGPLYLDRWLSDRVSLYGLWKMNGDGLL